MPTKQEFLTIEDVMGILGLKETRARQIVRRLNIELEDKGYITFKGKVPKCYFEERVGLSR